MGQQQASVTETDGRPYVHDKCNRATVVTGSDWVGLCNPFAQTMGTICSHCGTSASLKHFAWTDTGENLQAYVRRLRKKCPVFWQMWFWWLGPVCGAVLVAVALHYIGPMFPLKNELPPGAWAGIGAFHGLFVIPFTVTPWLAPRASGIEFHRER